MITYTVNHLFCGIGGGAVGFDDARFEVDGIEGRFETGIGADVDPRALNAFEAQTGGRGVVMDFFDEAGYRDFHGEDPPVGWREMQPADLRAASAPPDVLYTSPPCVGMSRLISANRANAAKYQAANSLTVRGIMLALEAWRDCPPRIILLENVPGLAEPRGAHLLDQILTALGDADYSVTTMSECLGALGGLGQRRQRLKLVARHRQRVAPILFRPKSLGLRSCGEVLGPLPLPGSELGGPMHRLGHYTWRTWLRLALIRAGGDWRDLRDLTVVDGNLRDLAIEPLGAEWRNNVLGVTRWDEEFPVVTGESRPTTGAYAVADPRPSMTGEYGQLGVVAWNQPMGAVSGQSLPGGGRYSIQDPRLEGTRHNNVYRVVAWDEASQAITAGTGPSAGGQAIADPRAPWMTKGKRWAGPLGVMAWDQPAGTVIASSDIHTVGASAVADPRLPAAGERGQWLIIAADGTWHRPITSLDAATLQGFDPADFGCGVGSRMVLEGDSATQWRRWIGNAVPPPAARMMAETIGRCLLQADLSVQTALWSPDLEPWARPLAAGLSVDL